jgi:prepilin-type processing-associated H-X9-DG protein
MKQWTLGTHNYESTFGKLPYAAKVNPRTAWPVLLWPYVEMTAQAPQYNKTIGFWENPNTITSTLNGVVCTMNPIYFCPSDRGAPAYQQGDIYWRARGNYVINWGPVRQPNNAAAPTAYAPWGYTDFSNRTLPRETTMVSITDGTSNTLAFSEVLMHDNGTTDWRGDFLNDDDQCGRFMTFDTPNNGIDELRSGYCNNVPERFLPCIATSGAGKISARSRHTGGVNVSLCDGSVRFMRNTIALTTWQAMSTMNGQEIFNND